MPINPQIDNLNIAFEQIISTPEQIKSELPLTPELKNSIETHRKTISNIIHKHDPRLLVISGPCSIHDYQGALDYAERLQQMRTKYASTLNIIMRVYFEKPRTTVGWKGFINDPHIDGSFDLEYGLRKARSLLIDINNLGLPIATEALDPISPQYLSELVSWAAIGARTTESQTHRDMASGLSMPVGFKNGTDGSLISAINGMKAASKPQVFMGINGEGRVALLSTKGNPDLHLVLRGGHQPNYDEASIQNAEQQLKANNLPQSIVVDCSHGNSNKDYKNQPAVADHVLKQCTRGNQSILGIMLESNLYEGNQSSDVPKKELKYGVSITDSCIDWETTEKLLESCHQMMNQRNQ